jgi:hypothetical protein
VFPSPPSELRSAAGDRAELVVGPVVSGVLGPVDVEAE